MVSIILGAGEPQVNASTFTGCLKDVVVNNQMPNLATLLTSQDSVFTATAEGVTVGCGSGDPCATGVCPDNSLCGLAWQDHTCECASSFPVVVDGVCANPCEPNPCDNAGICITDRTPFFCRCPSSHSGFTCEVEGCGLGLFGRPSSCQRCLCDPVGVAPGMCDRTTGDCICNVSDISPTLTL